MFKAIICDIQGVLVKDEGINKKLVDFLIENKHIYTKLLISSNLTRNSIQRLENIIPKFFEYVDKTYPYDEVEYPKPSPRGFEQILEEWNLKPEEVIFIDDNQNNIQTAKSLGLKTIYYTYGEDLSTLNSLLSP